MTTEDVEVRKFADGDSEITQYACPENKDIETSAPPLKFKVGDRVRARTHDSFNGEVGLVSPSRPDDEMPYRVRFDGGDRIGFGFLESELETAPPVADWELELLNVDLPAASATPRRAALLEAADIVDNERNREYGEPKDNLQRTADLVKVIFPERQWTAADIARFMMLVKLARSVHEYKHDTAIDTLGWGSIWVELEEAK